MRSVRRPFVAFGAALAALAIAAVVPDATAATRRFDVRRGSAFVVVVNDQNGSDTVSRTIVSRFFLKKAARWDNGAAVLPVDLPANSPIRDAFSREVLAKSVSSIRAYWQQQIFSGRDVPPPEKGDDAAVLEFVQSNPSAIAYVSAGATLPRGVKQLTVTN
jgi:ABC-type phosphate transport system substrate-binding protein